MESDGTAGEPPRFVRSLVGPYRFLRIDGISDWACRRCGHAGELRVPVLVDWFDRRGSEEQRIAADGVACPSCDALDALQVPLLQYRRSDGIGLLVGLPPSDAQSDSESWIRDTLLAAKAEAPGMENAPDLAGAEVVVTVPVSWWGSVWNRPLAPRLMGLLPLELPISGEEAARWRGEAIALLELPDIAGAVAAVLSSGDRDGALERIAEHSELLEPGWQATVGLLLARHREAQPTAEARAVIESRAAVLGQACVFGVDGLRRIFADSNRLPGIDIAATADDPARRLAVLREVVEVPGANDSPLRVVAQNALVQALHGDPARSAGTEASLLQTAKQAVQIASDVLGSDHRLTLAAELNYAVCLEERADDPRNGGLQQAFAVLHRTAPRAAIAATSVLADVAVNYATLVAQAPGTFADNPEAAGEFMADAAHIRTLLSLDDRRTRLTMLIDEAAVLRSKQTGSRRENAFRAIELLQQASDLDRDWKILTPAEVVLLRMNRSNALTQLFELSADDVSVEDLRRAARETMQAVQKIASLHPVAIQARTNAGASLLSAHLAARGLRAEWEEAHGVLLEALAAAQAAFPANHPVALRAGLHLAAACGTAFDGEVVERDRAVELLQWIVEHSEDSQFTMTAASNLAQVRSGTSDWAGAAQGYATAAAAQESLLGDARSQLSRLGVIMSIPDLAARQALALVLANRPREAIAVLERARARLTNRVSARAAIGGQTAVVHVATCDHGTLGVVTLPNGELEAFASSLTSGSLKPRLAMLLNADGREERELALDTLLADLLEGVVAPVNRILADKGVLGLVVVACGTLASCPLHVVGDAGRTWTDQYTVRYRVIAERSGARSPSSATVVAIVDPTGTLPFAAADREAVRRWADSVNEPALDRDAHSWLLRRLPKASAVHLACHAECDAEDAMRSAFQLDANARVTVADMAAIATPELTLVVAPACQSAAAGPGAPDELLGVGHALAHAGAGTVIASLWDAEDATTALVVCRLYVELARADDAALALTQAQRFVSSLTGPALAQLARARLREEQGADWLPYDLAIEFSALSMHPDFRDPTWRCFGHPAQWGTLSCLEA